MVGGQCIALVGWMYVLRVCVEFLELFCWGADYRRINRGLNHFFI